MSRTYLNNATGPEWEAHAATDGMRRSVRSALSTDVCNANSCLWCVYLKLGSGAAMRPRECARWSVMMGGARDDGVREGAMTPQRVAKTGCAHGAAKMAGRQSP